MAIVVGGFVAAFWLRPKEPSYQGRTVTEWAFDYLEKENQESSKAIRALGTNALPVLLKLAGAHEGKLKASVVNFLMLRSPIRFRIYRDFEKRNAGMRALDLLKDVARPAIPGLIKLTRHPESSVRFYAIGYLWEIHAERAVFLPVLTERLSDSNMWVREKSAIYLDRRFPNDAEKAGAYAALPLMQPRKASNAEYDFPSEKK